MQTSADAIYGARHVGLKAGLPIEVPALTVNRLCGSGIQAVVSGAQIIQLGEAAVVLAGGIESMSQAPHVIRGAARGPQARPGQAGRLLWEASPTPTAGCRWPLPPRTAPTKYSITREAQDELALRSQQLAAHGVDDGRLADEVVPVEIKSRKGVDARVAQDDHMRPETTIERLAKLPPVFKKDGGVTAGNASGIVDGGAALCWPARPRSSATG